MNEPTRIDFTVYGPSDYEGVPRTVECIKLIRELTGLGLQEAKSLYDGAVAGEDMGPVQTKTEWDYADFMRKIFTLRNISGLKVKVHNQDTEHYAEELRQLAVQATLAKDYYVAEAITGLLREKF